MEHFMGDTVLEVSDDFVLEAKVVENETNSEENSSGGEKKREIEKKECKDCDLKTESLELRNHRLEALKAEIMLVKGYEITYDLVVYGTNPGLVPLIEDWRKEIEVSIGNIFYFSRRNHWTLSYLEEQSLRALKGLLQESDIKSVKMKNLDIQSTRHDKEFNKQSNGQRP